MAIAIITIKRNKICQYKVKLPSKTDLLQLFKR